MTRNVDNALREGSRFGQRVRRRYADQLTLLAPGLPDRESMQRTLDLLGGTGCDLATALRTTRQLVIERLMELAARELGRDPAEFRRQNALLANVWRGLGASTLAWEADDRHHFSVVDELEDPGSNLVSALVG